MKEGNENGMPLEETDSCRNSKKENNKTRVQFIDSKGKYQVNLPWKQDVPEPMSSHYELCKSRLLSLQTCLKQSPELLNEYDSTFREQQAQVITERVEPENEMKDNIHFLSHHCI